MSNLLSELDIIEGKQTYPVIIHDEAAHNKIGTLANLNTESKDNIVAAINEIFDMIEDEWFDISTLYTDDLGSSINAAIADGYKKIYIPAGRYTIDTTARLNISGIHIRGAGQSDTVLINGSTLDSCFFIADTRDNENTLSDISIGNFSVSGTGEEGSVAMILFIASSYTNTNHEIINPFVYNIRQEDTNMCIVNFDGGGALNRTENYWIKNAVVYNCESYSCGVKDVMGGGIHFTHSVNGLVEHCTVDNSGQECYTFDNYCRYMTLKDCYVGNNRGGAGAVSIDLCEGFVINNCTFDSHWSEVPVSLSRCSIKINDEGGASRGFISDCRIFNNTSGIIINAPLVSDYGYEVISITDCIFSVSGTPITSNVVNGSVDVSHVRDLWGNTIILASGLYSKNELPEGYYKFVSNSLSPSINDLLVFSPYIKEGININESGRIVIPSTGLYEITYQTYSATDSVTLTLYANESTNYSEVTLPVGSNSFKTVLAFTKDDTIKINIAGTGTVNNVQVAIKYVGNCGI